MYLYPARRTRNVLTMILGAPTLHEAHADRAHLGELVHGLEALVHRMRQQLSKLLVVEDLEAATGRDLADGGCVKAVRVVALSALDKDGVVAQTLCKDFSPDVEEMDPLPDVSTDIFDGRVTIHVGEKTETETIGSCRGIGKSVHHHVGACGVKGLADTLIQFVVSHRAPVGRLLVLDRHHAGREHGV